MKRTEKIETICRRFARRPEWLLIRVDRFDKTRTKPLTGSLLAHDSNPDVIFKRSIGCKGLVFVTSSQKKLPEGYAVAF